MISRLGSKVPIQTNNNSQNPWSTLIFPGCGLQMYGRGWYPAADMRSSSARGNPEPVGFPGDGLVCRENEGLKIPGGSSQSEELTNCSSPQLQGCRD